MLQYKRFSYILILEASENNVASFGTIRGFLWYVLDASPVL